MNNIEAMKELIEVMSTAHAGWDNGDDGACDLICAAMSGYDYLSYNHEDWPFGKAKTERVKELIKQVLDVPYDGGEAYIINAAHEAFEDPTESSHAAHIRDALRDNGLMRR